jgi:hypothetical protein
MVFAAQRNLSPIVSFRVFACVVKLLTLATETHDMPDNTGQLAQAGFVFVEVHAATFIGQ